MADSAASCRELNGSGIPPASTSKAAASTTSSHPQPQPPSTPSTSSSSSDPFPARLVDPVGDRASILGALSDGIYDGNDYLAAYYPHWLRDPRITMCCCSAPITEANPHPEVVAFDTIVAFDCGTAVFLRALRVNSAYRGQGLAKKLSAFIYDHIQKHMPTVTKLRITTTLNNAASIGMHERQGYRRVLETGIFIATAPTPTTDCSALTAAVASSGSLVVRASAAELWRVLSRDATTTTELSDQAAFLLRGTKTFIYDWVSADVTLPNFEEFERLEGASFAVELDRAVLDAAAGADAVALSGKTQPSLRALPVDAARAALRSFAVLGFYGRNRGTTAMLSVQANSSAPDADVARAALMTHFLVHLEYFSGHLRADAQQMTASFPHELSATIKPELRRLLPGITFEPYLADTNALLMEAPFPLPTPPASTASPPPR